MTTEPVDLTKVSGIRDMALKWAFSQGVSTVLLFGILAGIYIGVPKWLEMIAAGYDRFGEQMVRDQQKDRELFERLLREVRSTKEAIEDSAAADKSERDK